MPRAFAQKILPANTQLVPSDTSMTVINSVAPQRDVDATTSQGSPLHFSSSPQGGESCSQLEDDTPPEVRTMWQLREIIPLIPKALTKHGPSGSRDKKHPPKRDHRSPSVGESLTEDNNDMDVSSSSSDESVDSNNSEIVQRFTHDVPPPIRQGCNGN